MSMPTYACLTKNGVALVLAVIQHLYTVVSSKAISWYCRFQPKWKPLWIKCLQINSPEGSAARTANKAGGVVEIPHGLETLRWHKYHASYFVVSRYLVSTNYTIGHCHLDRKLLNGKRNRRKCGISMQRKKGKMGKVGRYGKRVVRLSK